MTASNIATDVRATLATALSSVAANVYSYVPETVTPPAVAILYTDPMMELLLINKSTTKVKLNFVISAAVAYNSNPASLDNLEQLIISILAAIPAGYEIGSVSRPSVSEVGAAILLVSDITLSTYYTQTL